MARQRPEKVRGLLFEHGSYVVRMVVPVDVREAFGRREFRENLKTDNRVIAAREGQRISAEWKAQIAKVRAGETPEAIKAVVDGWKAKQARRGVQQGGDDLVRLLYLALAGSQADGVADMAKGLNLPDTEAARLAVAKALMEVQQVRIHNDRADEAVRTAEAVSAKAAGAERAVFGDAVAVKPVAMSGWSLDQFYKHWTEGRNVAAGSAPNEANYIAVLKDFMGGDFDLATLTKIKVVEFWRLLRWYPARRTPAMNARSFVAVARENRELEDVDDFREPLSNATLRQWLKFFNRMMTGAIDLDIIEKNPFGPIKVEVKNSGVTGEALSPEAVQAYFSTDWFDGSASGWGDRAWLSVAALMTGCRIGELRTADQSEFVKLGEDYFFDLRGRSTKNGDPRRVKNDSARRLVPLHPALVNLGFVDWVKTQGETIFGGDLAHYSKSASALMRGLSLDNTFHDLRHTFSRMAHDAKMDVRIKNLIMGHAAKDMGELYGRGAKPDQLADEMKKVVFVGIQHLK